jgi:hypothetical protein
LVNNTHYMLCIAYLFIKLSSEKYFGTAGDSPVALRYYAYALMKQAYQLNRSIFAGMFNGWCEQLLMLNKAYGCTDMVTFSLNEHLNHNPELKTILHELLPISWA